MLRQKVLPISLPRQHNLRMHRVSERHAALKRHLHSHVHSVVPAGEDDFHGIVENTCRLENRSQWSTDVGTWCGLVLDCG